MKKNDWILTVAIGLYSYLFYKETAGINFLLFNIALIILLIIKDKWVCKNKNWLIAAMGSLLSAICIAWYGNTLSIIANIVSLSVLSSFSLNQKSSVALSLLYSIYSYFTSPIFVFVDSIERRKFNKFPGSNAALKRVWLIVIPVLITFLFFLMYRASNPLFNDFAKKINLNFISWNWVTFTLGGFILLYGFFFHKKIKSLAQLDENASDDIDPNVNSTLVLFGKKLVLTDEEFSGKIMFALLNILLLIVNVLDINFLFLGGTLPKDVSHSQFVHQGINMLITSILLAIAIILFYFRGALNFHSKGKTLKLLAYFWIIQNVMILISTGMRNNLYINEFGLTYKRIGVYIYLFLCILGLATTFIKILKIKSNHFLIRVNGWLFYFVLIISGFFNWDLMITSYNISYPKWLEKNYLLKLSDTNIPQLVLLQHNSKVIHKEFAKMGNYHSVMPSGYYALSSTTSDFEVQTSRKLYDFMNSQNNLNWKSWCFDNNRTYNELLLLDKNKKIKHLKLAGMRLSSLQAVKQFNNIQELHLCLNQIDNLADLRNFSSLKTLDIRNNNLINLNGIEHLVKLEYLSISGNPVVDYSPLYKLQNLKELHINRKATTDQYNELQVHLPNTKIIRG